MSRLTPKAALVARTILALNRPVERGTAPARAVDMLREPMLGVWHDPAHAIRLESDLALRAIDDASQFCWVVRPAAGPARLSHAPDPIAAILETRQAAGDGMWVTADTRSLARAVRRRQIRFRLDRSDFEGLPGRYAVLGRLGVPGWAAAWLVPLTPDLGAALWSAHRRTARDGAAAEGTRA